MDKEQILALAEKCGIFPRLTPSGTDEVWGTKRDVESFFYAAIESYKAELLNEVGEPVAFLHQWIEYHPYGDTFAGEPCSAITNDGKPFDKSDTVTPLFTSDQVAAAVLKATKPLEEEITCLIVERDDLEAEKDEAEHAPWPEWAELLLKMIRERTGYDGFDDQIEGVDLPGELAEAFDYIDADEKKLRAQLAKAEQLWQVAQGRCDGLEEKLAKAEQRAAEACALQVATETKFHWLDAARVAKEIRSGEWRKFLKEV